MPYGFRLTAAALAFALLAPGPLHAQTNDPAVPMQPEAPDLDPKACTDRDRLTRGDTVETDGSGLSEDDASDKLARTDGVICPPPGLDPRIHAPAPDSDSEMPVVPPPGSPGGRPDARPK
jgi:hypothetical protein